MESLLDQLDQDDLCTLLDQPDHSVDDVGIHSDDLDDLKRLQSAVDMMRSPLFSAIIDIRSRPNAFLWDRAEHVNSRNGTTAGTQGGATPPPSAAGGRGVPDSGSSHHRQPQAAVSQASSERYTAPHSTGSAPVINGGSATTVAMNGVVATEISKHAPHVQSPPASVECNGFSSFVLRSTFASGI